jgi:dihydroorotase
LKVGAVADLTVFDPNKRVKVDAARFRSKSRNTPFDGWELRGAPVVTIVAGRLVWS